MLIPITVIAVAIVMIVFEVALPGRSWPRVAGWWVRAAILNSVQIGMVFVAGVAWDGYMAAHRPWSADALGVTGGAIVGYLVPEHDPVYKVSIIPRGRALGVTMFLPEDDKYSYSKKHLESQLSSLFGGRIAEEMINGEDGVTTGASNDIERATEIARNMVTKWGLSDRLGPLTYSEEDGEVFLGRSVTQHKQVSDVTVHTIDEEVRNIIDRNYERAAKILKEHEDKLHVMAKALMKYETIDQDQVKEIMEGKEPTPPEGWDDSDDESTPAKGKKSKDSDSVTPIGGPASEH